jgi:membrane associated rhomboid family serine protease
MFLVLTIRPPSLLCRYLPWKEFIAEKKGQNNMPVFTYTILFLCTLLLLISFALNGWTFESLSINPSLGPSPEILLRLGAKDSMLIVNEYEIWRLFTPMVLRKYIDIH